MHKMVLALAALIAAQSTFAGGVEPHSAIIFVADGLRGAIVDAQLTPAMDALRKEGASFPNSHSLFPTVTTANASAIATGHYLGDTGDFANTIYAGFPAQFASGDTSVTPFLEDDAILGSMDAHYDGNYLTETSLLALARAQGFSTAALGKLGPTLIQDHTERSGASTIELDDRSGLVNEANGAPEGVSISPDFAEAMHKAGLPLTPPLTDKPNVAQQRYWLQVASKVVLPLFKQRGKPFVLVLWMRDPDATQHAQLDSRYGLVPGINGSTSLAAIRNTDDSLAQLRMALKALDLERNTNLFVTSDHGFSTISKESETSHALKCRYDDVPPGFLPPGFIALDIADALSLPLRDPDTNATLIKSTADCEAGATAAAPKHPRNGSGLIGRDPAHPDLVVTSGAGSALLYLTSEPGKAYSRAIVNFLLKQDYVGGVFVDDALGQLPGTIPLSAIGLAGGARTPRPSIIVSFSSYSTGCSEPLRCGVEVSDSGLSQGQGMHGAFSRADTFNFMAATGPDFRKHFVDPAPVSNADITPTLAQILHLRPEPHGKLVGRALVEALPGGQVPHYESRTCLYAPTDLGRGPAQDQPPLLHLQPALRVQNVGSQRYFDAAGLIGRTLGLEPHGGVPCSN